MSDVVERSVFEATRNRMIEAERDLSALRQELADARESIAAYEAAHEYNTEQISALRQELQEAVQNFENLALEHDKCGRELRETAAAYVAMREAVLNLRSAPAAMVPTIATNVLAQDVPALAGRVEKVVKAARKLTIGAAILSYLESMKCFDQDRFALLELRDALIALNPKP